MKQVAGRLKIDLAQFRAMEAFAMFASDLDPASRAQLARGARLVELLKQRQSNPYPVEEQVVSVWAGTTGKLDKVKVEEVRKFEQDFLGFLHHKYQGVLDGIRETGKFDDDTEQTLEQAIAEFHNQFETEEPEDDRRTDVGREPDPEELSEDSMDQEQITRHRR
jgi:F-type H+/Na+-transporting ATPase subunit alpha